MLRIEEHRRVDRQLAVAPQDILKRYEKWQDIAMISGPPGLRMIKGFHDEALSGKWKGHRSSRLGILVFEHDSHDALDLIEIILTDGISNSERSPFIGQQVD